MQKLSALKFHVPARYHQLSALIIAHRESIAYAITSNHDIDEAQRILFRYLMELRHLRYFIAVAQEGHITRAAERLGMEQPPLSRQIKAMERELDVQLFLRKPRGVDLTDAGRIFLHDARAILARLDRAFEATRRTARGEQGRICLGVTPTSPFHPFVSHAVRTFRKAYPLISITLEEWHSNDLIEHLRSERIDAAFIRTTPADSKGLVISELMEEELVVVLPEEHILAKRDGGRDAALPLRALADETFIIQGGQQGLSLYADTIAACHAAGFSPRVGHEAPRIASTLNLVAVGLGISIVPASLQRMQIDGVVYRRLRSPTRLASPLMLASRRGDPSAALRHYLNLVKQAAKEFSGNEICGLQKRKGAHPSRAST
jgi:DNA-binding transcriptional LysR family regulator